MSNSEYNRRATQDDFLKQTNEVRDERRAVPISDILDTPLLCLRFNEEWKSHILGAVSTLQKWSAWEGDDDDTNTGTRQITKFLAQDFTDCGGSDCTIEDLLADDEFYNDEYLPATFGSKYTNTETNKASRAAAYDGTPQSIGSSIPTGTPNATEKNALCGAILRFVRLYCSEKICVLQSRNFLEIGYQAVEDAAEAFYDSTLDQMLGVWSDNLFGCIVDVPTALTALADESAQETLACYLLDQLDGAAITETLFNTAIDNAAISLSGNAQDIACVMSEDNAQFVYLAFLEGYNTALLQQQAGTDVDCPCTVETYKLWRWNFVTQGQGTSQLDGLNGGHGTFTPGVGWQATNFSGNRILGFNIPQEASWKVRSIALKVTGTAVLDNRQIIHRPTANSTTGQSTVVLSAAGTGLWNLCRTVPFSPTLTGIRQWFFRFGISGTSTQVNVEEVAILYEYDFAAPASIPYSDDTLCD